MTRQLDILIADENYFKFLVNEGYIISLEEILSTEELSEFKNINNLFYSTNKQDPTNKLYGIPMENASGYITQFEEFSCKDKYIGIVRHTERKDNALKVLRDFIK